MITHGFLKCCALWLLVTTQHSNTQKKVKTAIVKVYTGPATSDMPVNNPVTNARMAKVANCADEHNWWDEKTGGMLPQKISSAHTILTDTAGYRKVIVHWSPGKNFPSNSDIPCVHANPFIGNIEPGKTVKVPGSLTFTILTLKSIIEDCQ